MVRNRRRVGPSIRLLACCLAGASSLGLAAPALAVDKPSADRFYSYDPAVIAGVPPGTVLKSRAISVPTLGVLTTPFLAGLPGALPDPGPAGTATATVATVIPPPAAGPPAPTKLLSYQTFYDGLDYSCRPSFTLQGGVPSTSTGNADNKLLLGFVRDGYTVVSSDYEGPADDYTAGRELGPCHARRDPCRGEQARPALQLTRWAGRIFRGLHRQRVGERAPARLCARAPDQRRGGGWDPADYAHLLANINGSTAWSGVIPALALGLVRAYRLDPTQYFNVIGQQVLAQVAKGCLTPNPYPGLHFEDLLKPQYRDWKQVPELRPDLQRRDHGGRRHAEGPSPDGGRKLHRDRRWGGARR